MEECKTQAEAYYIGSLISLICKSEIRYEGVLLTLDTEKSTIVLKNVRLLGTEGRGDNILQIPPKDQVYDYIIFRDTDIKDLSVKSILPAIYNDTTQGSYCPSRSHSLSQAHCMDFEEVLAWSSPRAFHANKNSGSLPTTFLKNPSRQRGGQREKGRVIGAYKGVGNHKYKEDASSRDSLSKDFDFDAMNEKFNKTKVWEDLGLREQHCRCNGGKQEASARNTCETNTTYKKALYIDNFFDFLSCDDLDWKKNRSDRIKFSQRQKINKETFGCIL